MATIAEQIAAGLKETRPNPTAVRDRTDRSRLSLAAQLDQALNPAQGISDLLEEDKFAVIAKYMEDKNGMTERDYSREEIRDAYVNSMRGFNAGNSVDVVQEMSYLYRGEGEELTQRRNTAAGAYDLWDSLDGAFSGSNTFGQKLDAVGDYAKAIILDPVNIVSLGFGKAAAAGATRAGTQGLKVLAQQAGKTAIKEATKRGLSTAAARQEGRIAAQRALQASMKSTEGVAIARRGGIADVLGTGASDVATGIGVDAGIQKVDRMVGRQDEYSLGQGAIAGLGGVVGAGIAGAMLSRQGTSGLANTTTSFARSNETIEAATKRFLDDQGKINAAAVADELDVKKAQSALKEFLTPFQEYVEQGRFLNESQDPASELYEMATTESFLQFTREALVKGGIPIDRLAASQGQRRSGWLIDVIEDESFPNELYDDLQAALDTYLDRVPGGNQVKLGSWLRENALQASEAGKTLRAQRMAYDLVKTMKEDPTKLTGGKALFQALGDEAPTEEVKEGLISKFQHTYIRMLVTNPATTALNVMGWGQASALQSLSDTTRGLLYGGNAVLNGLVGRQEGYAKFAKKATLMAGLQRQKFRNLADPFGTRDEVLDYLTYRPDAQDAMFRYLAGGVESKDIMDELNLIPGETLNRSGLKKAFDGLQSAYGVSAQDMLTKTQEFAYALDKNIRLKYGMSWSDFMAKDDIATILMDPKKSNFTDYLEVEAGAVEAALGNVYARKFGPKPGDPKSMLKFVAGTIEDMRNVPILGALVPFGQFFNNTVSFMYDYTGANLVLSPFLKGFKQFAKDDPMELLTKAAVGWSAFTWATSQEISNLEDGLAWHESRGPDGTVVTRMYDYPLSFWKMAGRIGAHLERDQAIPPGLLEDFLQKFAGQDVFQNLGEAGSGVLASIEAIASGESGEMSKAVGTALGGSVAMYASGMTRFVDPVNTALAFAEGENYIQPTRNIGNKQLNNALRYTDQIFDMLVGLENIPGTEGYRVEQEFATTDRDTGAAMERVFGVRTVSPHSSIQRLFNDVGRPQWQTEMRVGNAEAQNVINEYVFPYLEVRSNELFENGRWEKMDLTTKQEALNKLLGLARDDVRDMMKSQLSGSHLKKAELIYQVTGLRSRGRKNYMDTLESFGVQEDELDTLDEGTLELLVWFIKDNANNKGDLMDQILGE